MNINILFSSTINALGWTLVHSLWQGLVLGLLLYMVLQIFQPDSPRFRFLMAVSFMVLMFAVSAITFYHFCSVSGPANQIAPASLSLLSTTQAGNTNPVNVSYLVYIQSIMPFIIVFWFLGFVLQCTKLFGGILYTQRLKKTQVKPVSKELEAIFIKLTKQFQLDKAVQLLESQRVQVPMVIGYLKPAILVPASIFSGFSEKHIESILVHELAHIHRNDYLINILVSAIKTIFYYHPVVWWMSSMVEKEREYCCDDIAINYLNDSKQYAHAMFKLYQNHLAAPQYAMPAFRSSKNMLQRIKRITTNTRVDKDPLSSFIMIFVMISSFLIITVNAQNQLKRPDTVQQIEQQESETQDVTLEEKQQTREIIPSIVITKIDTLEEKQQTREIIPSIVITKIDTLLTNVSTNADSVVKRLQSDSVFSKWNCYSDSLIFNFPADFDSMHFKFDENFMQDFSINIDSMHIPFDISMFMQDSAFKDININIPNINIDFDSDAFHDSFKKLDSIHIHLDSLKFDHINDNFINNYTGFDSLQIVKLQDNIYYFQNNLLNSEQWLEFLNEHEEFQKKLEKMKVKLNKHPEKEE